MNAKKNPAVGDDGAKTCSLAACESVNDSSERLQSRQSVLGGDR